MAPIGDRPPIFRLTLHFPLNHGGKSMGWRSPVVVDGLCSESFLCIFCSAKKRCKSWVWTCFCWCMSLSILSLFFGVMFDGFDRPWDSSPWKSPPFGRFFFQPPNIGKSKRSFLLMAKERSSSFKVWRFAQTKFPIFSKKYPPPETNSKSSENQWFWRRRLSFWDGLCSGANFHFQGVRYVSNGSETTLYLLRVIFLNFLNHGRKNSPWKISRIFKDENLCFGNHVFPQTVPHHSGKIFVIFSNHQTSKSKILKRHDSQGFHG